MKNTTGRNERYGEEIKKYDLKQSERSYKEEEEGDGTLMDIDLVL